GRAASVDDDIDVSIAARHGIGGQANGLVTGMPAGAGIELEAVPRADQVQRPVAVVDAEAAALAVKTFLDAPHQLPLAHRPALVRAFVAPCEEVIIEPEYADLDVAVDDDPAVARRHLGFARYENFLHAFPLACSNGDRRAHPTSVRCTIGDA